MTKATIKKNLRYENLIKLLNKEPFLSDAQIADKLEVSIPTVRLDRINLGIKEVRERIKERADTNEAKIKAISPGDVIGEIYDLELNVSGKAVFTTKKEMTFENSEIVRGEYMYSFAESTALAIIDAESALVGIANIKYKVPVKPNQKIIAKAEVKKIRENSFIVWVFLYNDEVQVFRGKYLLVTTNREE